mmetsp:Transcript_17703/g.28787  ORF Transcript_17703/g.28787 Transcript_17703/m.28787 type:complete len:112 (+) Transcript_17703:153-488(+)
MAKKKGRQCSIHSSKRTSIAPVFRSHYALMVNFLDGWSISMWKRSSSSMDNAAKEGHLAVVKWLHKNRQECTTQAMNLSAWNGHLHVVEWLHANRSEGCTTWGMNMAAVCP